MLLDVAIVVAKWLGSLPEWQALLTTLGTFLAAVVGPIWTVVRAVRKQRKIDMLEADVPVLPRVEATAKAPEVTAEFVTRMARLENAVAEWDLKECRAEVRELQKQLARASADESATSQRIIELTYRLELEQKRTSELLRERDELRARLHAVERADTGRPPPLPPPHPEAKP